MATPLHLGAFLPMVLPHAPGVPEPVACFNLRLAAVEFCERTRCWRHVHKVTVTGPTRFIVAPSYSAIHEIEFADLDGNPLDPIPFADIAAEAAQHPEPGAARYITQAAPNAVTLYPWRPGLLHVGLILKPSGGFEFGGNAADPLEDAYDFVPDFLLSQHGEAIAHGALARVLAIPGEAWSDAARSAYYLARFNERMDRFFAANMRGQQRAPLRTRPVWM